MKMYVHPHPLSPMSVPKSGWLALKMNPGSKHVLVLYLPRTPHSVELWAEANSPAMWGFWGPAEYSISPGDLGPGLYFQVRLPQGSLQPLT